MNPQETVEYVRVSQAAIGRLTARVRALEGADKQASEAAAALIPGALDALEASGLIRPGQRPKAAEAMADHAGALKVLTRLGERAVPRPPAEAPEPIGAPEAGKRAAATPEPAAASHRSEADRILTAGLLALRRR